MVRNSTPRYYTSGGWRLIPTEIPMCLAFAARLYPNQLIESKSLFQQLSPGNCVGAYIFSSSRLFVSPMLSALLLGSLWMGVFYVIIAGLPQPRDKAE